MLSFALSHLSASLRGAALGLQYCTVRTLQYANHFSYRLTSDPCMSMWRSNRPQSKIRLLASNFAHYTISYALWYPLDSAAAKGMDAVESQFPVLRCAGKSPQEL